jgi:hypothetical protein
MLIPAETIRRAKRKLGESLGMNAADIKRIGFDAVGIDGTYVRGLTGTGFTQDKKAQVESVLAVAAGGNRPRCDFDGDTLKGITFYHGDTNATILALAGINEDALPQLKKRLDAIRSQPKGRHSGM